MNIKHFITIPPIIAATIVANSAHAVLSTDIGEIGQIKSCVKTTCPSDTSTLPFLTSSSICKTYATKECYTLSGQTYVFNPCASCEPGYSLTDVAIEKCGISKQFTICACICSDCVSDSTYTDAGTGYQKKITKSCLCGSGTPTCTATTQYRCAVGYYGSSINGTSGCTRCPASGGIYGTTAAAGSTAITQCYFPSGTAFSDGTGSGTYTGNCYWKN